MESFHIRTATTTTARTATTITSDALAGTPAGHVSTSTQMMKITTTAKAKGGHIGRVIGTKDATCGVETMIMH